MHTKATLGKISFERWAQVAGVLHLTQRERQVAELICAGALRKEVADIMGVTVGTVNALARRMYKKAGCNDRLTFLFRCHDLANDNGLGPPAKPPA